jgi:hypothetical protein
MSGRMIVIQPVIPIHKSGLESPPYLKVAAIGRLI